MTLRRNTRTRPIDVVVAGLAVVDVIGRPVALNRLPRRGGLQLIESVTMTTGGNVPNFAIDLAKLGFKTAAITRVGTDGLGAFIREELAAHGVDTTGVVADRAAQTSATMVCVDQEGERTFLHTRGCLRNFRARDVRAQMKLLQKGKILAFGYLGLLPECEKELPSLFATVRRRSGVRILLDTGGTPTRNARLLGAILPHVDYFLPSYDEAVLLTGERSPRRIIAAFRGAGAAGVVGVKLGARGCLVNWNEREELVPPLRVRHVVDATGAGDAFISGFLAGILRGFDPFAAARVGNAVAASCITAVGASTAIHPLGTYIRLR